MKNRLLLVDGMALLFRGYFATAYTKNFMYNEDGIATNGVHQFLRYFLDGIKKFDPTHVICCWDMGSKTFRTEIYPNYKSNRGEPPEELVPQFDLVKKVVDQFNIPNIGLENYEADDIIGTLANEYAADYQITIQTGDLDMLQLVRQNVEIAIMRKGIGNYDLFTDDNFFAERGLNPHQIIDFKGFTGDSADNYPGIKGIGEKTALSLLQKYHNFDNILLNIHELTPGQRKKIETDVDMFHLSKQLATIKCDLSIACQINDAKLSINFNEIDEKIANTGIRFKPVKEFLKL